MKIFAPLFFRCALCVALGFLIASPGAARAQSPNAPALPLPEPLSEAEQLKSQNVRLQAQLREAELAIERNRAEAQEAARAQAAAITEKLNTIQLTIDAERKRQQEELNRDLQKSNRTLLYVAAAFGCVGLLAMLGTAIFQWRATNRLAEIAPLRAQLALASPQAMLSAGAPDNAPGKTVEVSHQRLMSVIDRLERRVFELEHTAAKPLPVQSAALVESAATPVGELDGNVARITVLLGKGQALLDADKPEEALACYDEVLALDANYPEALVKKGAALERLKKDDEALTCYDRAIAADGSLTIAYLYKGGVYNRLERYNEALECYEQALRAQGGAA